MNPRHLRKLLITSWTYSLMTDTPNLKQYRTIHTAFNLKKMKVEKDLHQLQQSIANKEANISKPMISRSPLLSEQNEGSHLHVDVLLTRLGPYLYGC